MQLWIRRFRPRIFDVKENVDDVKKVDRITEIIEFDRHVNSHSIAQKLKIDYKKVVNNFRKTGFKKKLEVPHQLKPKNMMDRISFYEALAKRNDWG